VRVDRWGDADDAKRLIQVAIDAARVERPKPT
jgi:hypothetical protein